MLFGCFVAVSRTSEVSRLSRCRRHGHRMNPYCGPLLERAVNPVSISEHADGSAGARSFRVAIFNFYIT